MKATYIDYSDTQQFSATLLAYIDRDPRLAPFIAQWPSLEAFGEQMKRKANHAGRALLADTLSSQYGVSLQQSPAVRQNIEALRQPKTFTVTTGHQLNLFTGPLYFIFKIVSTIRLAQDLNKKYPEAHVVPVYWMATEDHDFEEINHTKLYGRKISWQVPAQSATGRMFLKDIEATVRQYIGFLGLSDHSTRLASLVEEAYLNQSTLAEATRTLVNALFGSFGLIIVDADHPDLKRQFLPIIQRDILEQTSQTQLDKTTQQLHDLGFTTQITGRPINFFYLTDDYRERLVSEEGRFQVMHQDLSWSKDEIWQEMADHPDRFSPNVVMRPVYQEVLLPNLAYIGGGAEIVYWLQLKGVFDAHGVPFPILLPRNSAMVTDNAMAEKIFRLNLTFKSIFKDTQELKNDYVRRQTKHRLHLKDEWMEFNALFGKIKLRAHKIDPSLGPSTEAVKARLKKAMTNLEKKLLKAEKRNHQDALQQIDRIKEKLFPNDGLQERSENFGLLYVKYGDDLVKELLKHLDPLPMKFTILY
jgi:bacillithiol biosynthesis cysteine-adding enzyme BshC